MKTIEERAEEYEKIDALWLFVDGPEWVRNWYERKGYVFQHYDDDGLAVMMKKIGK